MGDFQEVYDEFKNTDLNWMMINGTDGNMETRERASKVFTDNGYTMPIYFDEGLSGKDDLEIQKSAAANYPLKGYPTTVFIDRGGNVAGIYTGALNKETLKKLVAFIMDDANVGRPLQDALK